MADTDLRATLNVYNADTLLASIPKAELPKLVPVPSGEYTLQLAWADASGNEGQKVTTDKVTVTKPTTTTTTTVKPTTTTTTVKQA